MDDEIVSMTKFGVHKALPQSAAGNRGSWDVDVFTNERSISLVKWFGIERGSLLRVRMKAHDFYDPDQNFQPDST